MLGETFNPRASGVFSKNALMDTQPKIAFKEITLFSKNTFNEHIQWQ